MGGGGGWGGPKKGILPKLVQTKEVIEPNYSLSQAQHNKGNPDRETEEVNLPKEPEERSLLGRL